MVTLPMTKKPAIPTQAQQSVSRASLALATNPERALHLAPNLQPDVDLLTAEGLIAFGVKGSGKSNLLALLVEQFCRFLLPQLIIDTEGEQRGLLPLLPHGLIATASACPSGYDIIHKGLQVIVDIHCWGNDEAAALAMCQLISELFAATNGIVPQDRYPCVIHLDEASYWLPQDAVSYLSKDTRKALSDAFHKLASRGRKQGLTPFLYTQSISEVRKETIRQAGIQVLMRQTLDIDVNRYCEYIYGATEKTRAAIRALSPGKAIVILPDGSQHKVQFYARASEHSSHTPGVHTALVKFATLEVDVAALPMRDLTTEPPSVAGQAGSKPKPAAPMTARLQALLREDPTLRPVDLMRLTGCSQGLASRVCLAYFEAHPEEAAIAGRKPLHALTQRERVYALLDADPMLTPKQLAERVGCTIRLAQAYRSDYGAPLVPKGQKQEQQIRALLQENPHYTPSQIQHRMRMSLGRVRRIMARIQAESTTTSTREQEEA